MKNKKGLVIGAILLIIILVVVMAILFQNSDSIKPEDTLNKYISYINDKNYDEMYNLLTDNSKSKISKEDFVTKNKNIYEGIDSLDVKINVTEVKEESNKTKVIYDEEMFTSAGKVNFSNSANLVKQNEEYKLEWSTTLIFPELKEGYKVRVKTLKGTRGSILDRDGNKLAYNGTISSVGIVPGKLGENKDENIAKISELTGVSVDAINNYLSASYVKDDTFVPIKKVSKDATELKEKLLEIPGVLINDANGRLKASDGTEIYIEDEDGNKVSEVAKQEQKNGEDITITIDSSIQKQLYDSLKDDKGLFVVMHPQTGELLALVSTPSYNSNDFALGMTNEKWEELNNDSRMPLYNRFLQKYCPGSTFKPITGAIGLTTGKITQNDTFSYTGTSWQKDSSWGDYKVTTLTAYNGPKNLLNGMIHSDNIYFAQLALKIGSETFTSSLDKLGFNEQIDFPLTLAKSIYSNSNTIETEGKLADSGFGQGNILVNPIHMASIYSSFANGGNMIKPYIEYKENAKGEILKENVFSEDAANVIKNALIQVVENPEGTAKDMKISGVSIAGKTGTAELKQDKNDTQSGTLGWFNCFTNYEDESNNLLVISMVENTQNNTDGGSHYLIKKIRQLFIK